MPDTLATVSAALEMHRAGRTSEAVAALRRAVQRDPTHPDANHILGMLLYEGQGPDAQAEYYLRRALALDGRRAQFHGNLGNFLADAGQHDAAERALRGALALEPRYAPAWIGLTRLLLPLGRIGEALEAGARAVELAPGVPSARANYGLALLQAGRAREAVAALRAGLAAAPGHPALLSSLAFAMNYADDATPAEVFDAHRAYGRAIAATSAVPPRKPQPAERDRRLRVAYLSPDFRAHSVAWFVEALFRHHDRSQVEVVGWSNARQADGVTARLQGLADRWGVVAADGPDALARRAANERIDVLVDLAGNTAGHRLEDLARRLAPVQVTYLGYPATTGVPSVDARLVDATTDPPGAEALSTEELVRLDRCFLAYAAPDAGPAVPRAPAGAPPTFGSFNALPKLSPSVLDAWSRLLAGVPGARLVLKARGMEDGAVRAMLGDAFKARGIETGRVEILPPTPGTPEHLALYGRIDVALDTFPYNGTTTTVEALWMGVPVVTFAGASHAGRVGASLLAAVGLPDLVAPDLDGYCTLAAALVRDRARLSELRATLRERVRTSQLCDGAGLARSVERALRALWHRACGGP